MSQMRMDVRYTKEERQIVERAVSEANRALEQLWDGSGRKYFVGYIELNAERYDEERDTMVPESAHFLAGDARD